MRPGDQGGAGDDPTQAHAVKVFEPYTPIHGRKERRLAAKAGLEPVRRSLQ